jgi:hypothetical protein
MNFSIISYSFPKKIQGAAKNRYTLPGKFFLWTREKFFSFRFEVDFLVKKFFSRGGPKEKVPWERVGIFLPHPVV